MRIPKDSSSLNNEGPSAQMTEKGQESDRKQIMGVFLSENAPKMRKSIHHLLGVSLRPDSLSLLVPNISFDVFSSR